MKCLKFVKHLKNQSESKITNFNDGVEDYAWSKDGDFFSFSSFNEYEKEWVIEIPGKDEGIDYNWTDDPTVVTSMHWRSDGVGELESGENHLYLVDSSGGSAIKISDSKEIDVIGIDMDEVSFTEAYTKNISTWQLFKRGRLESSMTKSGIEGETPEEIALNMESSIRQLSGFASLERERVKTMAENLRIHSETRKKILSIIEVSNVSELIDELK